MKSCLLLIALAACGAKTHPPIVGTDQPAAPDAAPAADPKARLLAAENDAYAVAKPVFDAHCARCHAQGGQDANAKTLTHLDITSYPFGGRHVATLGPTISHVLGLDGSMPTMPGDQPGSVQGSELATLKAWADAWQAADDAGAHPDVLDQDPAVDED